MTAIQKYAMIADIKPFDREDVVCMKKHEKKMIAPVIITILAVVYFIGFAVCFFAVPDAPAFFRALILILPLAFAGVMIGVLYSRIKEIRSGEEDDLSKY